MSLVILPSASRTDTTDESVTKSLEIALAEFGSVLTDDERKQLQQIKCVPDASAALVFTAKLDAANSNRRGKSIGARAYSMLQSIQQFSSTVDTFVSSRPDIAALVWGSVKLTVLLAANITSYFESLADLFMGLNKLFPQFDEYQLLFPSSPGLRKSICIFHASIVQLCKQAILITRQPWIRKVTTDLRGKLRPQIDNIQNCAKDVKKAIVLAKDISDQKEQKFQEQERNLAANHRKQMSIFASWSQKGLESSRQWQIQRDLDRVREERTKLLDSLSMYAYQTNFRQARKKRHVNTATWLFSTLEFTRWKDGELPSVFILTGKLGSGKTVLTSSVIDYLHCERTRTDELITFVFPRFDDSVSLSSANVLRSIIRQSLKPEDVTGEIEKQLAELEDSFTRMDAIEKLLLLSINRFSTLYVVIDALDEFEKDERSILLRSLSSIISVPDSKAKLFLVGRSSVLMDIRKWFPACQEKSVDCREVQADIEAYTEAIITLRQEEQLISEEQLVLQDPTLAQEIITALIDGANGMFLWVNYQIAEICECTCDDEIREVLISLPKHLGETFDRALRRIMKRGSAKIASHIFQWVAAAKRPLTLDELREALSYEPGKPYSIAGKRPSGLERIATWCENLVQLDEELQIAQFTHHSALQHLLEIPPGSNLHRFYIKLEEVDHFIGEICVTYLDSSDFKTDLVRNPGVLPTRLPNYVMDRTLADKSITSRIMRTTQKLKSKSHRESTTNTESMIAIKETFEDPMTTLQAGHPFLKYASDCWLLHTRSFEEGKSRTWNTWKQIIGGSHSMAETPWSQAQFDNQSSTIYDWIDRHDHFALFTQVVSKPRFTGGIDPICRYAKLGWPNHINFLINLGPSKEDVSIGLWHAAKEGHLEIVQRLLDANADGNVAAIFGGQTALQAAAGGGYLAVVQALLDAKTDVNAAVTEYGQTALQAAAGGGYLDVVQRLIDAKADVNAAATKYGQTALQAAARGGYLDVVQALLDAKSDVNVATTEYGQTALQAAARGGYLDVVQRLINAKANVNAAAAKYEGRTALQAAAGGGYLDVVQMLLDAGADVNTAAAEIRGQTALQAAAGGGYLNVVERLIHASADVNATAVGFEGRTALQAAAEGGYLVIVQRLLYAGADVNTAAAKYKGRTALQAAAGGGYLDVVQRLLDSRADVNAAAAKYDGQTALQAAIKGDHSDVVSLLKSHGARK